MRYAVPAIDLALQRQQAIIDLVKLLNASLGSDTQP
jgi:hypothetical protein